MLQTSKKGAGIGSGIKEWREMHGTGRGSREYRIKLDGRRASIYANVDEDDLNEQGDVYSNPLEIYRDGVDFISASLVYQKFKQVMDGVYAVVERDVAEKRLGIVRVLEGLSKGALKDYFILARVSHDGGLMTSNVQRVIQEVNGDSQYSVPQGFFCKVPELKEHWAQVRVTCHPVSSFFEANDEQMKREIEEVISRSDCAKDVRAIRTLYGALTDKLVESSALFPFSFMPDQNYLLARSIAEDSNLEQGLGKVLVEGIREGELSFKPDSESGLFRRTMHALEDLVARKGKEFKKYLLGKDYRNALDMSFIALWAATRHTHVARSAYDMVLGACLPVSMEVGSPPIEISPDIQVEPLATMFERLHLASIFAYHALEKYDQGKILREKIWKQGSSFRTYGGDIGEELYTLSRTLEGLSLMAKESLHMEYIAPESADSIVGDAKTWIRDMGQDRNMNTNMSFIVPIARENDGRVQVCYVFAGFKPVRIAFNYEKEPKVTITPNRDHEFVYQREDLYFPVVREVRIPVGKVINDRGLHELLGVGRFHESELDAKLGELGKVMKVG